MTESKSLTSLKTFAAIGAVGLVGHPFSNYLGNATSYLLSYMSNGYAGADPEFWKNAFKIASASTAITGALGATYHGTLFGLEALVNRFSNRGGN